MRRNDEGKQHDITCKKMETSYVWHKKNFFFDCLIDKWTSSGSITDTVSASIVNGGILLYMTKLEMKREHQDEFALEMFTESILRSYDLSVPLMS